MESSVRKPAVYLIALFMWIFCCASAGAEELIDRIVAVVNNEVITLSDLKQSYHPHVRRR